MDMDLNYSECCGAVIFIPLVGVPLHFLEQILQASGIRTFWHPLCISDEGFAVTGANPA